MGQVGFYLFMAEGIVATGKLYHANTLTTCQAGSEHANEYHPFLSHE